MQSRARLVPLSRAGRGPPPSARVRRRWSRRDYWQRLRVCREQLADRYFENSRRSREQQHGIERHAYRPRQRGAGHTVPSDQPPGDRHMKRQLEQMKLGADLRMAQRGDETRRDMRNGVNENAERKDAKRQSTLLRKCVSEPKPE